MFDLNDEVDRTEREGKTERFASNNSQFFKLIL